MLASGKCRIGLVDKLVARHVAAQGFERIGADTGQAVQFELHVNGRSGIAGGSSEAQPSVLDIVASSNAACAALDERRLFLCPAS